MKQRLKKQNTPQIQKALAAEYRKVFFSKMRLIIDSMCGKDIYPLIPQWILDNAYQWRCTPFKIKADSDSKIPAALLNDMKAMLPEMIKKQVVLLPSANLEISLFDFYTVYYTIIALEKLMTDTSFCNAPKVKAALSLIGRDTAPKEQAHYNLHSLLFTCNLHENDLRKALYWFKHDLVVPKNLPAGIENTVCIYSANPEIINIEVDKGSRPAFRVGWVNYNGPNWVGIKPSVLGFKGSFGKMPLKVYIQSHAINRLLERVDCFLQGIVQYNLYCSLMNPKVAYDNNNNLLIEYSFFNSKAGYFRADIVNGVILLRTFLFVTNNGTPEGQLLEKITGLQKLDKMYLNIDKLSTFMNSDLDKNAEVQRLFKKAGCQSLIDLYNNMKPLLTKKDNNFNFDMMLSYMNASDHQPVQLESALL